MRTAVRPVPCACAVSLVQVRVDEDLDLVSAGQVGAVFDTSQYDGRLLLRSARPLVRRVLHLARVDRVPRVEPPAERDQAHRLATNDEEVRS